MSELKADGFGVFAVADPLALAEETVGDAASYGEFVKSFVAEAEVAPDAARSRSAEVTDRDRELDPLVDGAHELVDRRLGDAEQQKTDVIARTPPPRPSSPTSPPGSVTSRPPEPAGKGFAVVANEVKELAKLTAQATQDIADRVGAIQGDARGADGDDERDQPLGLGGRHTDAPGAPVEAPAAEVDARHLVSV